jgi:hypothetical protein
VRATRPPAARPSRPPATMVMNASLKVPLPRRLGRALVVDPRQPLQARKARVRVLPIRWCAACIFGIRPGFIERISGTFGRLFRPLPPPQAEGGRREMPAPAPRQRPRPANEKEVRSDLGANFHDPGGAPRMMEDTLGCAGQRG